MVRRMNRLQGNGLRSSLQENMRETPMLPGLKAGFTLEGVIRAAEWRAGAWRDGLLYSRLRHDPAPEY